MSDETLINEVRAAMRNEVADVTAPATLLADVRRRHTRRGIARRITFLVAPVTAAAVIAGVIVSSDPGPQPANVAYVKEQTSAALDKAEHDVVYEQAFETGGGKYSESGQRAQYERWYSADHSAFRVRVTVDGTVVRDESTGPDGGASVDYREHTWFPRSPLPKGVTVLGEEVLTPAEIREALENDSLRVIGPGGLVNGKPTILLSRDPEGKAEVPIDLWVDESTYLPVQFRYQQDDSVPFSLTWLEPTPENLALLTTPVPDGFPRRP